MTSRLVAVAFDAADPDRLARFWAGLLDRVVVADGDALLLPGAGTQVGVRFAASRAAGRGPEQLHLHLTSEHADQETVVEKALGLGARHLDVGQLPEETHVVLADPEGNAFCVIPPGNTFLAGCGLLGEVACDGGRAVGVFWSEALGWPLVWDEHGETAVQSPLGGTKVAWGGPAAAPPEVPARQWFELQPLGDPAAEVERLVALGAGRIGGHRDGVVLADPDGYEFRVRT